MDEPPPHDPPKDQPQAQQQHSMQPPSHQPQSMPPHAYVGFGIDPNWCTGPMHHHGPPQAMHHHHHHGLGYHGGIESALLPSNIPGLQVGASMDPLESVLGPFPCARLRGLPYNANLEDVLMFFQGLVVLDVVVDTSHSDSRGSGEAFVIFANPVDFQMALQRDRQIMGRRYIEVFQGTRSDYYAAIASQFNRGHDDDALGEGEIFANDESALGGNIWAGSNQTSTQLLRTHQSSMEGAIEIPTVGGGGLNQGHRNKGSGGPSGNRGGRGAGGGAQSWGVQSGRGSGRGGGIQVGEHTGYLRMRGLPFTSSKDDIAEFFKEYNPVEDTIVLTYRSDGRATGEGYVAFASPDDAERAMVLHRSTMGSRYIELFISNKDEHARWMARSSNVR